MNATRKRSFSFGTFRITGLLCLAVTAALLFPLFCVDHPQAIDLANHLARQYIRQSQPSSHALSQFYFFEWMLVPYMAFDVLAGLLLKVFSVYDTGRIVLGIIIFLSVIAPVALYRALWGQWSPWPLLAALVVYNGNIAWGFAAYSLAAPCVILAFAGWISTENQKPALRLAIFLPVSLLLYFGHLVAFGVFGLLMAAYELNKLWTEGPRTLKGAFARGLLPASLFILPALHFLYINWQHPPLQTLDTQPLTWQDRWLVIASPFMNGLHTLHGPTVHDVSLGSMFLFAGVYGVLAAQKSLSLHRHLVLCLVLMTVISLLLPARMLGISFMHYRLPFMAVMVLVAATKVTAADRRLYLALSAAFALVLAARIADTTQIWKKYDMQVKEFISKTKVIPQGSKVLVVNREYPAHFVEHYHTASFLTIERESFIPNLFVIMHYFGPRGDYARLSHPSATHPMDARLLGIAREGKSPRLRDPQFAYWRTWWKDFDYIVAYEANTETDLHPDLLRPVARGSYFVVYKREDAAKKKTPAKTRRK